MPGPALVQKTAVRGSSWAWYGITVLTLVTLFSLVDRQILTLLAEPIRKDMGLSDLRLGLLQGTGIALFAAAASYPLGWLADRYDRRWVMVGCIAVWSAAVVACGAAQNFEQLFLASAMVGAGEAGLIPIVYSLIPTMFAIERRQLANSVYALANIVAVSVGFAICGWIIANVEAWRPSLPAPFASLETWRLSFFAAALPAPLMMLLLATWPPDRHKAVEPSSLDVGRPQAVTVGLKEYLNRHRRTFVSFYLGSGLAIFAFVALGSWIAVILVRLYGQTPAQAGAGLSASGLSAAAVGFVVSVFGLRAFGKRLGMRLPLRSMWIANLCVAVVDIILVFTTSAQQIYVMNGVYNCVLMLASMLAPTALQALAPSHLRGRIVAIQLVLTTGFGAAASPIVGWLSDQFGARSNGLLLAVAVVSVPSLLIASLLQRWCELHCYEKTALDALRIDAGEAQR